MLGSISKSLRRGGMAVVLSLTASMAWAAGPIVNEVRRDYNDPAYDVEETLWMSEVCGFPVIADLSGFGRVIRFDEDSKRSFWRIVVNEIRGVYTNPATGTTVHFSGSGAQKTFIEDGYMYTAVAGNNTFYGMVGLFVVNLDTGELVRVAGTNRDWNTIVCGRLAQ